MKYYNYMQITLKNLTCAISKQIKEYLILLNFVYKTFCFIFNQYGKNIVSNDRI